jgi:hypothetical protein
MESMWAHRLGNTAWAALPLLLVVLAVRPASAGEVGVFVDRFSVRLTHESGPLLLRLIVRNRASRFIGAALGLSLVPLSNLLGLTVPNQSLIFGALGYLIGAFASALVPIQPATRKREALLVPRGPGDYLPRPARLGPLVAVVVAIAASIILVVEPRTTHPPFTSSSLGLPIAVVAAAATLIAVRVIVSRPQPHGAPDLVALDDSLRSQALHTLVGAGVALALGGTADCLVNMGGYATNSWLHTVGWVGGILALGGALGAWLFCTARWRVSRSLPS